MQLLKVVKLKFRGLQRSNFYVLGVAIFFGWPIPKIATLFVHHKRISRGKLKVIVIRMKRNHCFQQKLELSCWIFNEFSFQNLWKNKVQWLKSCASLCLQNTFVKPVTLNWSWIKIVSLTKRFQEFTWSKIDLKI